MEMEGHLGPVLMNHLNRIFHAFPHQSVSFYFGANNNRQR